MSVLLVKYGIHNIARYQYYGQYNEARGTRSTEDLSIIAAGCSLGREPEALRVCVAIELRASSKVKLVRSNTVIPGQNKAGIMQAA